MFGSLKKAKQGSHKPDSLLFPMGTFFTNLNISWTKAFGCWCLKKHNCSGKRLVAHVWTHLTVYKYKYIIEEIRDFLKEIPCIRRYHVAFIRRTSPLPTLHKNWGKIYCPSYKAPSKLIQIFKEKRVIKCTCRIVDWMINCNLQNIIPPVSVNDHQWLQFERRPTYD